MQQILILLSLKLMATTIQLSICMTNVYTSCKWNDAFIVFCKSLYVYFKYLKSCSYTRWSCNQKAYTIQFIPPTSWLIIFIWMFLFNMFWNYSILTSLLTPIWMIHLWSSEWFISGVLNVMANSLWNKSVFPKCICELSITKII